MHAKTSPALFRATALALTLGFGATGCHAETSELDLELAPLPADATEFRAASWEGFPIVVEGVSPGQITNDTVTLGGVAHGLEDLIDVVAYARWFQPCDLDPDADLDAFSYDTATDYIDAAVAKRMHVMVPLPYLGSTGLPCDGVIDIAPDPDELWNHDHTVRIPGTKNDISSDYNAYWSNKVGNFIDAIDAYDTNDVVWSWRGLEELRYWRPSEVELARIMRERVDTHDGTRHLTAYTPNHYMPNSSMINTLLDRPHASLSPHNPLSVTLDPVEPVARAATAGVVEDFYPTDVLVNLEVTGALRPLFDHIMTGSYTGAILGADGHVNRIQPYHRSLLSRETRENLESIYVANGQTPPSPILFHAPDMSLAGVGSMTKEHAQHDFWAGLHVAEGLYLYNYAYRNENGDVWDAYARGLLLIKSQMRKALAGGSRWTPQTWHDGLVQSTPGDYYTTLNALYTEHDHLASALESDQEHATLNATIVAGNGLYYLIVTHSWEQAIDFEVTMPACTLDAKVVYGESNTMNLAGGTLSDSFSGIDGRVYQLRVAPC